MNIFKATVNKSLSTDMSELSLQGTVGVVSLMLGLVGKTIDVIRSPSYGADFYYGTSYYWHKSWITLINENKKSIVINEDGTIA
jgi:hypothetical protein